MAHHQELTLVKALADAVVQRKFGVDSINVKAHSKLHGNEVADHIANLAANTLADVETDEVHHVTDNESTRDRTRVPMVSRVAAREGERGPLTGG